MTTDGGLRALYRKYLPGWQLTAIESGITSPGVPDTEYCSPAGRTGWIENKKTAGYSVNIRPLQIAWIERRARLGGRVFIAVRRMSKGGPRSPEADELWIFDGQNVRRLANEGLESGFIAPLYKDVGGPARWFWPAIANVLAF